METIPEDPAVAALCLVRERLPKYGGDLNALNQRLSADLVDSGGDSPLAGSGHEFRGQVRQALVTAGYEVGNG